MYHPMLTYAVAQTRLDDLTRDVRHDRARRRLSPDEAYTLKQAQHQARLARRLARFATRRTRPSAA